MKKCYSASRFIVLLFVAANLAITATVWAGCDCIDTVSDLRAAPTPGASGAVERVAGYYAADDGGGGGFMWDSGSAATDDSGTVIKPTAVSGAGRWVRVKTGEPNARWFGAVGTGSTNDTMSLSSAINAANAAGEPLFVPYGLYLVTPGSLPTLTVGLHAPEAIFKAADNTDSWLLTVDYTTGRSGVSNDGPGWLFDVGGFVDSTGSSNSGTGLRVTASVRNKFVIRKAINLNYGVHLNIPAGNSCFENEFHIKTDSCNVGLQITTATDASAIPVDANKFYMGSSFNHNIAVVRINAGATPANGGPVGSDVHNNLFVHEMLEIPIYHSNGIVLTGYAINNQFIIYNQRGINGGKYATTDSNSTNNLFRVATWNPSNWSFSTNQQVCSLYATNGNANGVPQGRSFYWAPDVFSAVNTTIPSLVGDTIVHSDPGIGDNMAWVCTTAGTPGTWTAFGMRTVLFNGGTDTHGITAGSTQYVPINGRIDTNLSANNANDIVAASGTLRRFYVRSNSAFGAGNAGTFTLIKNNAVTGIVLTISGGSATEASDTSSTLAVTRGDKLCWEVKDTAGSVIGVIVALGMELLVDPS